MVILWLIYKVAEEPPLQLQKPGTLCCRYGCREAPCHAVDSFSCRPQLAPAQPDQGHILLQESAW